MIFHESKGLTIFHSSSTIVPLTSNPVIYHRKSDLPRGHETYSGYDFRDCRSMTSQIERYGTIKVCNVRCEYRPDSIYRQFRGLQRWTS